MLLSLQLVLKYHEILGEWLALARAIVGCTAGHRLPQNIREALTEPATAVCLHAYCARYAPD
jgi:hypothetical protein